MTLKLARRLFTLDSKSGALSWKIRPADQIRSGASAGGLSHGYIVVCYRGKNYFAHRIVWLLLHGEWPRGEMDHINGNRSDNIPSNLRLGTHRENLQNQRRHRGGRLVGASRNRGKWLAQIRHNGRKVHLGMFETEESAHAAYMYACRGLLSHGLQGYE